jgi:hypothetical protein
MNVRTIFGVLAWMLSSSLDASEVNSIIAISADGNTSTYLLSQVQRIDVSTNDTDGTMSVVNKNGSKEGNYQKLIFPSVPTSINGVEVHNVYVYPNPVSNTLYVNGVDENDTHLVVYDMNGNCISGEYGNEIEVAFLPKGTYILGINDYFVKFIKQ